MTGPLPAADSARLLEEANAHSDQCAADHERGDRTPEGLNRGHILSELGNVGISLGAGGDGGNEGDRSEDEELFHVCFFNFW